MGPLGDLGKSPLFCVAHWRHLNYTAIRCFWQSRYFTAIGVFFLHTPGHSTEKSCITELWRHSQVRSKSWCRSVSKPFLQIWYFCWQIFCSCPVLRPLNLLLYICWEKWFLAEKKKNHIWWNNDGDGEAALSQRPELWEFVTHSEYNLTFVGTLPCSGSSWTTTQPAYLHCD